MRAPANPRLQSVARNACKETGMSSDSFGRNAFTHGPLGSIYAKTALPIILVMSTSGLQAVIDAAFLGAYVGPQALGAVTLMFPLFMAIIALATLVGGGMASILARRLGANRIDDARAVFAGAHGLAITVSLVLIGLFALFGSDLTRLLSGGVEVLDRLGYTYLRIMVLTSPMFFVLSINTDALRNEGRAGLMALSSIFISLANIGFNTLLIVVFKLGVAGSAYGTFLAQLLAFAVLIIFRLKGRTELRPGAVFQHSLFGEWRHILALGAPQSLNFAGIALVSAAIITSLQLIGSGSADYQATVSAYGIITRIMSFAFLPLLGLSQALQAIVGNNYGAQLWGRSNGTLRLGLAVAFLYCLTIEMVFLGFRSQMGFAFVDDSVVTAEVARILPMTLAAFFLSGPLLMIASYFQAIGDAGRAAVLGLAKPYAFVLPMVFLLPLALGERGIWLATPTAEVLLLAITMLVLAITARRRDLKWGLFVATG